MRFLTHPQNDRAHLAQSLLRGVPERDQWMLLKGIDSLGKLPGDIDLLVHPLASRAIGAYIRAYFVANASAGDWLLLCEHVPGVPRYFARLHRHGFGTNILEVDIAEMVPFAGVPVVTHSLFREYRDRTSDGWYVSSSIAEEALEAMFKTPKSRISEGVSEVVAECLGPRAARQLTRGRSRRARLIVASQSASLPMLLRRVHYRLVRHRCSLSPHLGRTARTITSNAPTSERGHLLLEYLGE